LGGSGEPQRFVEVTADASATIADLASTLVRADPTRAGLPAPGPVTLRLFGPSDPSGRTCDPTSTVHEAGLRSGVRAEVVDASGRFAVAGTDRGPAAALVRVVAGPGAGREVGVPLGTSYIGRAGDSDVRLSDPLVSGRHARLTVGGSIELADLNSANGIILGGQQITRASLAATDQVLLGDTVLSVVPLRQAGTAPSVGSLVEHNRSPRVVGRFPARKVAHPKPPDPRQAARFPHLAMLAPLIMGAVMFAFTRQIMSVVFVALSPVLMIGSYVDQLVVARRTFKAQKKQFSDDLVRARETIRQDHAVERAVRAARCPTVADTLDAALGLTELLWARRPEDPDFLGLRLGVGTSPSALAMDLPQESNTDAESWSALQGLKADCETLPDATVPGNLRESGSIGVAGPTGLAADVARGLVWQAVGLHAPSEVVVAALMSKTSRSGWEWLEWLPHASSPHSPVEGDHLADNVTAGTALLAKLEELVESRLAGRTGPATGLRGPIEDSKEELPDPIIPAVVVVVADDAPVDRARLTRLLERGPDAGVHGVWLAGRVGSLPGACRTFLSLVEDVATPGAPGAGAVTLRTGRVTVGQVRWGRHVYPATVELVDAELSAKVARALAPVVDAGAPVDDDSDLPRALSYVALAGSDFSGQAAFVAERWAQTFSITNRDPGAPRARRKPGGLVALIGQAAGGAFTLDLRGQGPHALVGGTTGSGKSEFLQAWVMGLATRYSPDRVTFLLVDYKGGSAFADCVSLPHCVGLVTDLSPHLVRRALTSLKAELTRREHLLNRKKAKDLLALERAGDPDTPPSLIIIVDEFAALATEMPDFVEGVIDVAQRGRSLGLHLVLATQRPAGVITPNLRANTNLRIALRVADEDDSDDVLGDKMAAHFDPSIPGRAAAKTGPGRITPFQTGYVGGWTSAEPEPARIDVVQRDFGTVAVWEAAEQEAEEGAADPGPTDIARMVATVRAATELAGVPAPRKPWLEPLAEIYDLASLPGYRDDQHLVLGVLDDPQRQEQPVVYYEPDRDGNLAILGAGGSGKSTALRTIALSATFSTRHGGPVHVYGLDFGASGLLMLEDLPHVGAIIPGDDEERVIRLLRTLKGVVDERAPRYGKANAASIGDYRRLAEAPGEPRILLLIDGIGAFREEYEFTSKSNWFQAFAQIAADGRQLGVHLVMAGDRPNSVPPSIGSSVQRRIVLRLASEDDYLMAGAPKDILGATSPPGRGILDDKEIQIAVWGALGKDARGQVVPVLPNVAVQARETAKLAQAARRRGDAKAPGIEKLPDLIDLAELPAADAAGWPVIGVADDTLGPIGVEPRGALMVAGPPSSGRTTALATLAASLRRLGRHKLILVAPRRSRLEEALAWDVVARGEDAASALADELAAEFGSDDAPAGKYALILDNITEFTGTMAEPGLDLMIRVAIRSEQFVVGEGEASTWNNAWNLAKGFKAARRGLILVPGQMDTDNLMGVAVGRMKAADFPPGRGFLITGGRFRKLHVATILGPLS
jgi:S-DNA-T family DNA segregation ATPase FtsK/SpoIIIE